MGPRIGVLGSTTIDGVSPTRTQGAIVAALAYRAGRPMPTGELIDAIWCERVPSSARQSLQNQITRLRRRFGEEVIATDPAGYVLTWETDATAFEQTVAAWSNRGPGASSVGPLGSALALWRGLPFDDLCDHEAVEPERTRLRELRTAAAEQLGRSLILAGDLGRCATELAAFAEGDPYREQLWGLLMLALHLDGRRTDAARGLRAGEHSPGARPRRRAVCAAAGAARAGRRARPGRSHPVARSAERGCSRMRGGASTPRPVPPSAHPLGMSRGQVRQRTAGSAS